MWRWVARGLWIGLIVLAVPVASAQEFIGVLERPLEGTTGSGVILVSGWVLDQQQVTRVDLYVDDVFQHSLMMNLPRVDIVEASRDYEGIDGKRPGFSGGFLASRFASGTHTIKVVITTNDGRTLTLGPRTITIDNTVDQAPFGWLEHPGTGAVIDVNGAFGVSGWAADVEGITEINVLVDGGVMQAAVYGDARPDVANFFPDFPGALFSGFVANIDTTRIEDGVHTLLVQAIDTAGQKKIIGTREIQVFNSENNLRPFGYVDTPQRDATLYGSGCVTFDSTPHITPVRGWALDLGTREDLGRVSYAELLIDGVPWISTDDCAYDAALGAYVNCYGLPRYDIQRLYPTHPDSPRSGFFFGLDVGALMAAGVPPGHHVLKVRVGDVEQTFNDLPNTAGIPVFFECADETLDFSGFGFIDYPQPYDYVGPGTVTFTGWAVDENGLARVEALIDGEVIGNATTGFSRIDVRDAFPTVPGAATSGWQIAVDTTTLSDARHRLTIRTVDTAGRGTEIASQDFYVDNPD